MKSHTLVLLLALVILPTGVQALQDPGAEAPGERVDPTIAAMRVDIWPEYDDPRVLVIYDGQLAEGVETPTEFSFLVPRSAQIHMAGGIAPNGGHVHENFSTRMREDGLIEVSYPLQVRRFYMEFYYDPLGEDDQRRFTYPIRSRIGIDSLFVRVQEPLRATGFDVMPAAMDVMQDDQGLQYHIVPLGSLPEGVQKPVTVAYAKADRAPSVAAQAPEPAQQTAAPLPVESASPWQRARPWVLGVLAAGFFAMGLYRRFSTPASRAPEPKRRSAMPRSSGSRFCSQCGQAVASSHKYCGACGHRTGLGGP